MSNHPLFDSLLDLSGDDLDKRYNELSRRWQQARAAGMDQYVLHQLDIMLTAIEEEKSRRALQADDGKTVVIDTDPIKTKDDDK